jgi:hypothetical protein
MWMPAFVHFASSEHWNLVELAKAGCYVADLASANYPGGQYVSACRAWFTWAFQEVKQLHPAAIIISTSYWAAEGAQGGLTWTGLADEARILSKLAPKVVEVEAPPDLARSRSVLEPNTCLLANGATLGACTGVLTNQDSRVEARLQQLVLAAHISFLATLQYFCADLECPMVIGNTIAWHDAGHISNSYAALLGPPIAADLESDLK